MRQDSPAHTTNSTSQMIYDFPRIVNTDVRLFIKAGSRMSRAPQG
ncbi:hypothetical protein NBRC3257_0264 [Gluconobacter thailandicus NBRC 3257]|uniref:Uncharacterized protein n=1 Tax=Gluconobacter thailandicus NBRC 3257 TaxID=1381097 RepID=A0ABQ0ISS9_GLUTH|nr:hypothetical protein NBRC3255_2672 [Gluconobacter thailandicus NBRC 3255]GAD25265.1 hypothetical protein NBRC3257_0264 [Gluconobacter thailandicus NBRC 3257]